MTVAKQLCMHAVLTEISALQRFPVTEMTFRNDSRSMALTPFNETHDIPTGVLYQVQIYLVIFLRYSQRVLKISIFSYCNDHDR